MISKQETNFIKGIALILILVGHCFPPFFPYSEIYVPIKRFLSQVGVNLFLILSGYGVAYKYFNQNSGPLFFLKRRIISLWPVYAFAMLFYCLFSIIFFRETFTPTIVLSNLLWVQVFFNTQNEIYSASHFFSALLIAYLLASIMLIAKSAYIRLALYILAVGFFQVVCLLHYNSFLFPDYLASFSLGIAFAYKKEGVGSSKLLLFLVFSYVYCVADISDFITAMTGILFFAGSLKAIRDITWNILESWFVFLGKHSYIIYLGHNYFLWKWPAILDTTNSAILTGFIIIGATCVWMIILFSGNSWLNKTVVSPLLRTSKGHIKL